MIFTFTYGLSMNAVVPSPFRVVPTIVLDHVDQLDDELALLVLLTRVISVFLQRSIYQSTFWLFVLLSNQTTSWPLTYFQPRVVLQHSQEISATSCRPVNKTLSSAGPQRMFTLNKNKLHTYFKNNLFSGKVLSRKPKKYF